MRPTDPLYPELFEQSRGIWVPARGPDAFSEDLSGNGFHGTLTASPAWVSNGLGGAYDFNGSTQYVSMGDVLDFLRTDPFTLFVCFKTDSLAATFETISKFDNSSPFAGYGLEVGTDGTVKFILFADDATRLRVDTSAGAISTGTYYVLIGTYDGSSNTSGMAVYLNGVSQSLSSINNDLTGNTITTIPLQFPGRNGANTLMDGEVVAAGIWSGVMPAHLIALLSADPLAPTRSNFNRVNRRIRAIASGAAAYTPMLARGFTEAWGDARTFTGY